MSFEIRETEEVSYVHWRPWTDLGVYHGFSDKSLDFSPNGWLESYQKVHRTFGCSHTFIQNQQHTTQCSDFRDLAKFRPAVQKSKHSKADICADAMVCPQNGVEGLGKVCCGVVTADCIPLIVRCGDEFGLIHAGWRGLAGGIIEGTLDLLDAKRRECEVLVGPCAGPAHYEVGPEVVADIGPSAKGAVLPFGKMMLDLVATVRRRLEIYGPEIRVYSTNICTISNSNFHSFRRDGDRAGRSLTFLITQS